MSLLDKASLILTPNAVKESKLYSIVPSNGNGDMTVVRATTATRVNSLGLIENVASNVARLNYEGDCPSILLEPQRTNLLTYSEQFDNASYLKNNLTITANTITSPDGTINADTLSGNGVGIIHDIIKNSSSALISGITYSTSVYAKKNTNNFIQISGTINAYASNTFANFDLNNGVIGSFGGGATSTITNVGNGWYRCTMIATAVSTSINSSFINLLITSATSPRSESNTLSTSVYIWGAQIEQGAYPTSYIPTVASTVTRNLDDIYKTGIGADILNPSEGTFYVEASALANELTSRSITISDGTNYNSISIQFSSVSNAIRLDTVGQTGVGTSTTYRAPITVLDTTINHKILIKWGLNGIFGYVDGVKYTLTYVGGTVGGSGIPTALNRLDFKAYYGANYFSTKCKQVQLYKTALTDLECQQLTTL